MSFWELCVVRQEYLVIETFFGMTPPPRPLPHGSSPTAPIPVVFPFTDCLHLVEAKDEAAGRVN